MVSKLSLNGFGANSLQPSFFPVQSQATKLPASAQLRMHIPGRILGYRGQKSREAQICISHPFRRKSRHQSNPLVPCIGSAFRISLTFDHCGGPCSVFQILTSTTVGMETFRRIFMRFERNTRYVIFVDSRRYPTPYPKFVRPVFFHNSIQHSRGRLTDRLFVTHM